MRRAIIHVALVVRTTSCSGREASASREPKLAEYGTVALFEDLHGNLWDLVQMSPGHAISRRLASGQGA